MTTREDASLYLRTLACARQARAPRSEPLSAPRSCSPADECRALRALRRRNGSPAAVLAALATAIGLTLLATVMAVTVRGQEQLAHYTHTLQVWQADAYSCAVVVALAVVAWTALLGLIARRIEANRMSCSPEP